MALPNSLGLHEEILLLAMRDKEGTIGFGVNYQFAIAGAVAAELLLNNRIEVENTKKKMVNLLSQKPLGDPILDECLEKISSAKRRASMTTWVQRFARLKGIKHRVAQQLCQRGILRVDEDKVLLIFSRKIYPEVTHKPEQELVSKLKDAIFTNRRDLDPRTVVLVALAFHGGMLKLSFEKSRIKERKKRIEDIISGEAAGQATKEAIQAMQAAVMAAVIVPTVIAGAS